ncbi:MAG: hypothetical protein ALECFALPRED_004240 [Alectoria fallacina]|uniref:UNC-50 family protein n=1 Tax=Alectoria fallacina TaxID=1903189 RepID=A0A8H3FQ14_9LECA|nr:MAG: hypothetical protein ALECFALPRED_004240 [Alectoria fallacina]
MQSWQDRRESKHVELTPGDSQTIQVPADGFRDGNMGDDKPLDSAEESLQIDILPQTYASSLLPLPSLQSLTNPRIETKNTWHRPDPSFTYLLSFFMLLTGIAWGIAYTTSVSATVRLTILFVFVHFLAVSLLVAAAAFFLVGRLLGPGIAGLPGRRRQQGLFTQAGEGEQLEFGYCFDVAIRAFFPVWVWLYVMQFILWPLIARDNWVSMFFGNTLYLVALGYYTVICFLGYNALPFLHHTELLLSPCFVYAILWFASLFGFNIAKHVGPLLITGAG